MAMAGAGLGGLQADLRQLAVEAKKKNPKLKEAAEHVLLCMKTAEEQSAAGSNRIPGGMAVIEEMVRVLHLAFETKHRPCIQIAVGVLQKLIALDSLPEQVFPQAISMLRSHIEGGVMDEQIQLRVLQVALTILQSHGLSSLSTPVAQTLELCVVLSNNPSPVVSNTAAATIRQMVNTVFERIPEGSIEGDRMPDGKEGAEGVAELSVAVTIAANVLKDFALLTSGKEGVWSHLKAIDRAIGVEVLESIVGDHAKRIRGHPELFNVLRTTVCPLTSRVLSERLGFPLWVRVLRLVSALTTNFASALVRECEIIISALVRAVDSEVPLWQRATALETLKVFCCHRDAQLLRGLFLNYAHSGQGPKAADTAAGGAGGSGSESANVFESISNTLGRFVQQHLDVDATATNTPVTPPPIPSGGQTHRGLDMLGATDAPTFSHDYALYLAVDCLCGIVDTLAKLAGVPEHVSGITSGSLARNEENASACTQMAECAWPSIISALSAVLAKSNSELAVQNVLRAYQSFTHTCGLLELVTPRDAFITSLCKQTLPPSLTTTATAAGQPPHQSAVALPTGSHTKTMSDATSQLKALTPKNVQAMKTLFNIAYCLGGILGGAWTLVIETVDSLDRIVHAAAAAGGQTAEETAEAPSSSELVILGDALGHLFEQSKRLDDGAVLELLDALVLTSNQVLRTPAMAEHPGAQAPRLFAVEKMVETLNNNMHRIHILWPQVSKHLTLVANHPRQAIRQYGIAALTGLIINAFHTRFKGAVVVDTDDAPSVTLPARRSSTVVDGTPSKGAGGSDLEANTEAARHDGARGGDGESAGKGWQVASVTDDLERRLLVPLEELNRSNFGDTREAVLSALFQVLQTCGQALSQAWPLVLAIIKAVAVDNEAGLITIAFKSVQLIRNDFLSSLPVECMQLFLTTAGSYGLQTVDINVSLTAVGLICYTADFFRKERSNLLSALVAMEHGHFSASAASEALRLAGNGDGGAKGDGASSPSGASGADIDTVTTTTEADKGGAGVSEDAVTMTAGRNMDQLWLVLYRQLVCLTIDPRPEVRHCALRTLFLTLNSHGTELDGDSWRSVMWEVLFPVLHEVDGAAGNVCKDQQVEVELGKEKGKSVLMLLHHSRNTAGKQWNETRVLAFGGATTVFRSFYTQLSQLDTFRKMWSELLTFMRRCAGDQAIEVSMAATTAMTELMAAHGRSMSRQFWGDWWGTVRRVTDDLTRSPSMPMKALVAFVAMLNSVCTNLRESLTPDDIEKLLTEVERLISASFTDTHVHPSLVQSNALLLVRTLPPLTDDGWSHLFDILLRQLPGGQDADKDEFNSLGTTAAPAASSNGSGGGGGGGGGKQAPEHPIGSAVLSLLGELHGDAAPPGVRAKALRATTDRLLTCMLSKLSAPSSTLWRPAAECLIQVVKAGLAHFVDAAAADAGQQSFWDSFSSRLREFLLGGSGLITDLDQAREAEDVDVALVEMVLRDVLPRTTAAQSEGALISLLGVLDAGASLVVQGDGNGLLRERLSAACMESLFTLTHVEADCDDEATLALATVTAPVLLQRCAQTLTRYANTGNTLGACPHPRVVVEQVVLMLGRLQTLRLDPRVAAAQPQWCMPPAILDAQKPVLHPPTPSSTTAPSGTSHGSRFPGVTSLRRVEHDRSAAMGTQLTMGTPANAPSVGATADSCSHPGGVGDAHARATSTAPSSSSVLGRSGSRGHLMILHPWLVECMFEGAPVVLKSLKALMRLVSWEMGLTRTLPVAYVDDVEESAPTAAASAESHTETQVPSSS